MTIVLGVIAMILGAMFAAPVFWVLGIILVTAGLLLWALDATRHRAWLRARYR